MNEYMRAAFESREQALEAAINRFRDCGVELARFSIVERPGRYITLQEGARVVKKRTP